MAQNAWATSPAVKPSSDSTNPQTTETKSLRQNVQLAAFGNVTRNLSGRMRVEVARGFGNRGKLFGVCHAALYDRFGAEISQDVTHLVDQSLAICGLERVLYPFAVLFPKWGRQRVDNLRDKLPVLCFGAQHGIKSLDVCVERVLHRTRSST